MRKPLISVITVCYNAENCIEDTIKSVITQTYDNLEYIVVDGASTDNTKKIIENYSRYITVFISEKDNGIYDAMTKGINVAKGDWLLFKNCGDFFYSSNTIESVFEEYVDNGEDYIAGSIRYYNDFGYKDYAPNILRKSMFEAMPFFHPSTFIRRDTQLRFPFRQEYRNSADYCFFIETLQHGASYKIIDIVVSLFENAQGASSAHYDRSLEENKKILKAFHAPQEAVDQKDAMLKKWKLKRSIMKIPGMQSLLYHIKYRKEKWVKCNIKEQKRLIFGE